MKPIIPPYPGNPLPKDFFSRHSAEVARDLLGKLLVTERDGKRFSGIINETEAYRGSDDPASHAYRGRTERTRHMYDTYGHIYVYLIYGMYHCLNITTEGYADPGAVLIRSIVPVEGPETMITNRGISSPKNIANGPWKLCKALGIDRHYDGKALSKENTLWIEDIGYSPESIIVSQRIGIQTGKDKEWRYRFDSF